MLFVSGIDIQRNMYVVAIDAYFVATIVFMSVMYMHISKTCTDSYSQ